MKFVEVKYKTITAPPLFNGNRWRSSSYTYSRSQTIPLFIEAGVFPDTFLSQTGQYTESYSGSRLYSEDRTRTYETERGGATGFSDQATAGSSAETVFLNGVFQYHKSPDAPAAYKGPQDNATLSFTIADITTVHTFFEIDGYETTVVAPNAPSEEAEEIIFSQWTLVEDPAKTYATTTNVVTNLVQKTYNESAISIETTTFTTTNPKTLTTYTGLTHDVVLASDVIVEANFINGELDRYFQMTYSVGGPTPISNIVPLVTRYTISNTGMEILQEWVPVAKSDLEFSATTTTQRVSKNTTVKAYSNSYTYTLFRNQFEDQECGNGQTQWRRVFSEYNEYDQTTFEQPVQNWPTTTSLAEQYYGRFSTTTVAFGGIGIDGIANIVWDTQTTTLDSPELDRPRTYRGSKPGSDFVASISRSWPASTYGALPNGEKSPFGVFETTRSTTSLWQNDAIVNSVAKTFVSRSLNPRLEIAELVSSTSTHPPVFETYSSQFYSVWGVFSYQWGWGSTGSMYVIGKATTPSIYVKPRFIVYQAEGINLEGAYEEIPADFYEGEIYFRQFLHTFDRGGVVHLLATNDTQNTYTDYTVLQEAEMQFFPEHFAAREADNAAFLGIRPYATSFTAKQIRSASNGWNECELSKHTSLTFFRSRDSFTSIAQYQNGTNLEIQTGTFVANTSQTRKIPQKHILYNTVIGGAQYPNPSYSVYGANFALMKTVFDKNASSTEAGVSQGLITHASAGDSKITVFNPVELVDGRGQFDVGVEYPPDN